MPTTKPTRDDLLTIIRQADEKLAQIAAAYCTGRITKRECCAAQARMIDVRETAYRNMAYLWIAA